MATSPNGAAILLIGIAYSQPMQRRMRRLTDTFGPTGRSPDQAAQVAAMGAKMARTSHLVALTPVP